MIAAGLLVTHIADDSFMVLSLSLNSGAVPGALRVEICCWNGVGERQLARGF